MQGYVGSSEDIYGMDTSIAFGTEGFEWINKAPAGCIHGISEVQPTEEVRCSFLERSSSLLLSLGMSAKDEVPARGKYCQETCE